MIVYKSRIFGGRTLTILKFQRFICDSDNNYHIFKDYLGLHTSKIKEYVSYHKLTEIPPCTIRKIIKFCEEHGYTNEDMLQNPAVFRINSSRLDQQYTVMIEGGFIKLELKNLLKFRTLCQKDIDALKSSGYIHPTTDVVKSFITHLNPCPEDFCINSCPSIWSDVHLKVLIEYLKWKLEATHDQIVKLLEVHPVIRRKSFQYLCKNIKFAEELGFTKEKIIKNGYILRSYPKYTQETLKQYPELVGVPIKKAMRMYPKLIGINPSNIGKTLEVLKNHNIPREAIVRRLNVFYLCPDTVDFRLNELKRDNDFKVLLHNPNILQLVVHHNRAKSRLSFLKELQLKCTTVTVLGADDNDFDYHVKGGRDENSFIDTFAFLKGILRRDYDDFESTLKRHPFYLQVPLTTMEETFNYLIEQKFSNKAIFKVIYIILYPKEKLQKSLHQVKAHEKQTKRLLTQVNKLHLALYFIEKEHHFTGDGIWTKSDIVDETAHSS